MTIGTKSVLFGAHCFFLHPFFVAAGWKKLYGFPRDPRLWAAFFLHDIGYWGKNDMDGEDGESHPETGAKIMEVLFDHTHPLCSHFISHSCECKGSATPWRDLVLYHSRYYAKKHNAPFSKLCVADKLAFALTPRWLYLFMTTLTGEIEEYMEVGRATRNEKYWSFNGADKKQWHAQLKKYMLQWVATHRHGTENTWNNARVTAGPDDFSHLQE